MLRSRAVMPVVLGLLASTLVGLTGLAAPASAVGADHGGTLVSPVPATYTPDVNNGVVYAIGQVGQTVFLGGSFTSVSAHGSGTAVPASYIAAFNAGTGALVSGFAPTINGQVNTIIPGPAANQVYVGGSFTTVDGVTTHVALLNTGDGSMVSTFKPAGTNGAVQKLVLSHGLLFVGGTFTTAGGASHGGLVALDPSTGKVSSYVSLAFTGHHNYGVNCDPTASSCANAAVGVKSMDIDPSGRHLVAIGNFTSVSGSPRDQVAVLDLGATAATVDAGWATLAYTAGCFSWAFDSYVRDVQFSPDGSYFVIVGTGGSGTNSDGTNSSCDTAARFDTSGSGSDVRPAWIDYTGQDTLWTVAISGAAVYVGGHERWLNNSQGYDFAGPGAAPRPGIAALSPLSGVPLSWNPGRNPRGAGAYALLVTTSGLYVGSDTDYIGDHKYLHKKVAFFPLAGGEVLPDESTPTLPGRVYTAGGFAAPGSSNVLYRVNTGGPTIGAADNGPDWQGDQSDPVSYRNSGSNTADWSPVQHVDSTVPAGTPSAIFSSERWDPGSAQDGGELHFGFAVPAGDQVEVRLYLANQCGCTSGVGQRVFDVALDGQPFLDHYDIVKSAGDQTGHMEHATVTSDGEIDIDFAHETENPLINGIEIVRTSAPSTFPTAIYRTNAGGATIPSGDGPAAWLGDGADSTGTGTPVRTGGNPVTWDLPWGGTVDSSVPTTVPSDVFGSESWDSGNPDLPSYSYPVAPGTPLTVHLFFANNYGGTSTPGSRMFNVAVDGQQVLSNYDIVADVGDRTGVMKSFPVTAPADGLVTVTFSHAGADNPLVNAVELVQSGPSPAPAAVDVDRFSQRHFDGSAAGTEAAKTTGIAWGSVRGAFTVNGELIYGRSDGRLYERTFDGTTFGPEVALDPYDDPAWDNVQTGSGQTYQGSAPTLFGGELAAVTSMFFTQGRLYYTVSGDSHMHWREFEPESGIVGSDEFTTTDGNDWSHVAGAFLSGSTLYVADRGTGLLSSVPWAGGQAGGSPTVLDTGQSDWASRGMFLLADATTPNQPPSAAFAHSCSSTNNACTFDPSSSMDPDGAISDYAWNFGDGSSEHHPDSALVSHTFPAAGTFTVTLTVTDNDGATAVTTARAVVGTTPAVPTFRGAVTACGTGAGACGTSLTTNVAVPSTTVSGDALLLFVSRASSTATVSVPTGWHLLGQDVSSPLESDVYYRTARSSDVGSLVPVTFSAKTKNSVTLADYTGADGGTIEAFGNARDSGTATHTTPGVAVTAAGSLGVSYWADKSSTTTTWTPPSGVHVGAQSYDTGTGYVTSLLADSGSPVGTGSYGHLTAVTNAASGKGASWTIVLAPLGTTDQPPAAAFTPTCTGLTCNVDGSGSRDPDGTVSSYAWSFGDGTTTPASSAATASHSYATGGSYTVALTVTDNDGSTDSISRQVTVSGPTQQIGFGGQQHVDVSGTSAAVTVPAATGAGDALLLFESYTSTTATASAPSGWSLVGRTAAGNLTTAVYDKVAGSGDASSTVSVSFSASVKASLVVSDYTHTSLTPVQTSASATSSSTTSHTTPSLTGLTGNSWVVSYWSDKSSTTSAWTAPAGLVQRAAAYGSGSGADSALLADSGGPVSGSYAGHTATTNVSSGAAAQWAVALSPAT